ncbi:MAG: TlyA family RNA methyltransferase [Myxococcota bacterium]|nr:TlyA family RNA methyltransferase [Myxococcota bacterium]
MAKERIDLLLVQRGLVDSRTRAQARIMAGDVIVNEHRVDKAGTKVPIEAEIRLKGDDLPYVGRGGLKLAGALERWPYLLEGCIALDVGASTGGFTDVLLQNGAARVYAVDVGHNQLAWKLRQDPRVVNLEKTHIARLEPDRLDPAPSLGVVDVSFISLRRVLPSMRPHLEGPGRLYALVKPQFEVGRDQVGKGGIVRDPLHRQQALEAIRQVGSDLNMVELGWMESPIKGTDGNVEYLICWSFEAD